MQSDRRKNMEPIHAPHGTTLTCKSWQLEAPMRMLMNNLDPEVAERPEDLCGGVVLAGGCGGMSGAQLLAITMNGGVGVIVECDPARIQKRLDNKYIDTMTTNLDEALQMVQKAVAEKQPLSIGLVANAADVFPELLRRGVIPDVVTCLFST